MLSKVKYAEVWCSEDYTDRFWSVWWHLRWDLKHDLLLLSKKTTNLITIIKNYITLSTTIKHSFCRFMETVEKWFVILHLIDATILYKAIGIHMFLCHFFITMQFWLYRKVVRDCIAKLKGILVASCSRRSLAALWCWQTGEWGGYKTKNRFWSMRLMMM